MLYTEIDHTFAVCAYKESPYLEDCILSLLHQTVNSKVLICTSTPNAHIEGIAAKYDIPLLINEKPNGVSADFNFAFSKCNSRLVTLAHQDDIYKEKFTEKVLEAANEAGNRPIILLYSEYAELRDNQEVSNNNISKIKRAMNAPLKLKLLQGSRFIRNRMLSLGNPISCSAVTFCKDETLVKLFSTDFSFIPDWELWGRLAKKKGLFIYLSKSLVLHRIHAESTTSETIKNNRRYGEELRVLQTYWPDFIAKGIIRIYSKAYKSNTLS